MVIRMTSTVATIIHAVSPLFGTGAGAAAGAAGVAASAAGAVAVSAAFASSAKAGTDSATVPHKARSIRIFLIMTFSLKRLRAGFAGADADNLFQVEHEDLAVADLPGIGGLLDSLDHLIQQFGLDRSLDLYLGQEIHDVLGPAIHVCIALLH